MKKQQQRQPPAEEKPQPDSSAYRPAVPGRADFECIRANRFELVDAASKTRGGFGFSDQGYPLMFLTDDRGEPLTIRAELSLTTGGPALMLADSAGTHRACLTVKDSGSVSLALNDAKGLPRVCMILDGDRVLLRTLDSQGRPWRFVQEPYRRRNLAQTVKAIERAGNQDGKRGFTRAMGEVLDITDTAVIDNLWKDATERGMRKAKARKAA